MFFRHSLIVFGGVQGLEASLDADPKLEVDDPSLLFDFYLNTCPNQGSNTIRTEVSIDVTSLQCNSWYSCSCYMLVFCVFTVFVGSYLDIFVEFTTQNASLADSLVSICFFHILDLFYLLI